MDFGFFRLSEELGELVRGYYFRLLLRYYFDIISIVVTFVVSRVFYVVEN